MAKPHFSYSGALAESQKAPPGRCTWRRERRPTTRWSDAQARERRPPGSAQPAEGGRREGPPVRGGLSGREPGVQRHPDGGVVHAFRCALRSGADPHRENWPEVGVPSGRCHLDRWGSRAGLHFHSNCPEVGPVLPVGAPLSAAPSGWWRTCETWSFTASSWKSVFPIRHAVTSVGIRASRVTVFLVNRLRFPRVRFGP